MVQRLFKKVIIVGSLCLLGTANAACPPKVEIYTIPGCAGCNGLKSMLQERHISFTEYDLTGRKDLYADMKRRTGTDPESSCSVPQLFIDDVSKGGFSSVNGSELDQVADKAKKCNQSPNARSSKKNT